MSTTEDIRDDARMEQQHDEHVARGENHYFTCLLCDDESNDEADPEFVAAAMAALHGDDCGADYCVDPGNCRKHDR